MDNDDIPFDDQPTHSESLKALNELFLIAGQFTTLAAYAELLHFIAQPNWDIRPNSACPHRWPPNLSAPPRRSFVGLPRGGAAREAAQEWG